MPTQTETSVAKLKINRLTQSQFDGATTQTNELYLVDPEFTGDKLLQSNASGDIVESNTSPSSLVTDVQVNGTSVVSSGVANILKASTSTLGVIRTADAYGLATDSAGQLYSISNTYVTYSSAINTMAISKGTLENVITGKGLLANSATGTNALTILGNATSSAEAINIGSSSTSNGSRAIAIGYITEAAGTYPTAVGCLSKATTHYTLALGSYASASAIGSIAIGGGYYGVNARVTNQYGIAVGYNSSVSGDYGVAMGSGSAAAASSISIGSSASASGLSSTALGAVATASGDFSIQLGRGTNSTANTLSVGLSNNDNYQLLDSSGHIPTGRYVAMTGADGVNAGVIGAVPSPAATDNTKFLRGDGMWAAALTNASSVTSNLGILSSSISGTYSIALGYGSTSAGTATAVGGSSTASGAGSVACGNASSSTGTRSISVGYLAKAEADYAIQLGIGTNNTANTLSVGLASGSNYELLDSNGVIPSARLANALQGAITSTTVTLAAADWSSNTQTVNVTGMTATKVVWVSPTGSSMSDYADAGVYCSAQGSGTLTFTCSTTPTNDLTVQVVFG